MVAALMMVLGGLLLVGVGSAAGVRLNQRHRKQCRECAMRELEDLAERHGVKLEVQDFIGGRP